MVTWLTPDHGRIVTAVKGACRPKSAFLGQYDLFYTCDLLFYRREHDGVHAIRECAPLAPREPLRRDWRRAAAAAYIADLTARATHGHHEDTALYTLLARTLDLLADTPATPAAELILWYEIHLLRLLGLMPDFAPCPLCHTGARRWLRFSLPSGRFICSHRSLSRPDEATVAIHRGVQRLFQTFCDEDFPPPVTGASDTSPDKKNGPAQNLLFGLSRFLGIFIAFHLDAPSAVRRVAFELLNANPTLKHASLEM